MYPHEGPNKSDLWCIYAHAVQWKPEKRAWDAAFGKNPELYGKLQGPRAQDWAAPSCSVNFRITTVASVVYVVPLSSY